MISLNSAFCRYFLIFVINLSSSLFLSQICKFVGLIDFGPLDLAHIFTIFYLAASLVGYFYEDKHDFSSLSVYCFNFFNRFLVNLIILVGFYYLGFQFNIYIFALFVTLPIFSYVYSFARRLGFKKII